MSGGTQPDGEPSRKQEGAGVPRRFFLGSTLAAAVTNPTALASLVAPEAAAAAKAATSPVGTAIKGLFLPTVDLFTVRQKKYFGSELHDSLASAATVEQIEEAVLEFVSKRAVKHCLDLRKLGTALERFETSELGSALIPSILRDAREVRLLEIAHKVASVGEALRRIKIARDNPLHDDWGTCEGWRINLDWRLRGLSPDQLQRIDALGSDEVIKHIEEHDFTVDVLGDYDGLLDHLVYEASWADKDSVTAKRYKAKSDEIRTRYDSCPNEIRCIARALGFFPQAFANPASLVALPESNRHAAIPHMAHTGFLRMGTDALELYRKVAAPGGKWLSPMHEQAFYGLKNSLDALLPNITKQAMGEHFPEYMNSSSPEKRRVEENISTRAERAVDRQRAMFPWGPDFQGNDYY
jgi:hypothetical protein